MLASLTTALRTYANAWRSVFRSADLPGYRMLPVATRIRLDLAALWLFLWTGECFCLVASLVSWLLVGYTVVWGYGLYGPAAALLPSLSLLWVLPWVAHARRRALQNLLGDRWQ
jgi:hypothetical protein